MDPTNPGGVSAETIEAVRQALASPIPVGAGDPTVMAKATTQGISTTTGLVAYNLEAPSKKLFPVLSPLRNRFPRPNRGVGGTAVNWKAITAINASKVKAGVAEGARNSVVSTTEADKLASFKSFGLDDFVTDEAVWAGRTFEDVRAMAGVNLLSAVMIQEEILLLGGNVTAIGKPASLTFADTAASTIGSLTAATAYDYAVSALTLYGFANGSTGHAAADAADETDGRTGSHTTAASGNGSKATDITWPAVRGAVAYNVFAGTSGGTKYYVATVTTPYIRILSIPGSGNVPNTADQTADALSFDGVIPQLEVSGSGAYFKDLANATLTGDNAGGIVEFDTALQSLWDNSRIGPTIILVNSQEAKNGLAKIAANGSTTTLRLTAAVGADGTVSGGLMLGDYLDKFTQQRIPLMTHPNLPAGLILMLSERLPYPNNNVPNVFEVEVQSEYVQYDWARVQRKYEFGVYAREVLKVYFPAGCAVLSGIANG
ncbi:MAG TPA: hypothetical protein VK600_00405 [Candidatus Saccharimonadales bacterium]|nr:hypothetical protein [Candidatus Saccharimonadales bacterium]